MFFTGSLQTLTAINTVYALHGTTSHYLQKLMSPTSLPDNCLLTFINILAHYNFGLLLLLSDLHPVAFYSTGQ